MSSSRLRACSALIRFSRGCEAIKLMDETVECIIYNVVRRMLINTSINR